MKKITTIAVVSIILSGCVETGETNRIPSDIADYLHRTLACGHFSGEEPYDAERKAFLEKTQKELRCNELPNDLNAIEKKYLCTQNPSKGFYCPK